MTLSRWHQKANAFVTAWRRRFGNDPTQHAVVLGLSVAQHETRCGDAWPGPDKIPNTADDENNWGACTFRAVNAAEYAAIAQQASQQLTASGQALRGTLTFQGTHVVVWVTPTGQKLPLNQAELAQVAPWLPTVGAGHNQRAANAEAAILASGLGLASGSLAGITVPRAHIHCDSRPVSGGNVPYFVWFAAFATPADGCEYFLHLLAGNGKPAKAVLDNPAGTEQQLASAMYSKGYFTGFHDPKTAEGRQANIDAYAGSLRAITPSIRYALADWSLPPLVEPTGDTDPAPPTDPVAQPLPLDVDWDEHNRSRDRIIREQDDE
jgi:hypothetical protein